MFKSARWRNEKNKIKIVFKLQFHATQVGQLKTEGLTINVVAGDGGKSTGKKTEKALVLDGYCRWESPVYETVKFVKDVKTGKFNQRIYQLIVSTTTPGSTKCCVVGETTIDFAHYLDATKTCNVSLPLLHSNSNAMLLHVSIQRQLENVDLRRSQDLSIEADQIHRNDSLEEGLFVKPSRICELRRGASIESDSTLSSFDSVSELDHNIQQNHQTMLLNHSHASESEWSGSSEGISTDDSTNDTVKTYSSEEVDKLKAELIALTRRADFSELELQSLRKQIVKETKRSQDLLREVTSLKQERDNRKEIKFEGALYEELDYEKDLNSSLRLQLKKTQESNDELILTVQDLEAMLRQRSKKEFDLRTSETDEEEDEDQKALDELVKGHMDAKEAHVLEQRITDLYNDIEIYKRDKEDLEIQVEQLALDYEILKQENHDISYKLEQSQVHEQLKLQYECSSSQVESLEAKLSESLRRIKDLETKIESMEEELERRSKIFEGDIEAVTRGKIEQEQRAIEAEEALRKTRLRNASVAGKIQDEFKRISEQMSLSFAANEKMAVKAMSESHELRLQKGQLEELLMNANNELRANRVEYEAKLKELSTLEDQKRQEEDVNANFRQEIARLKDEIEDLRVELDSSMESLQRQSTEKDELVSMVASLKKEAEALADKKEAVINSLKSELENAISYCGDLKHSLSEKATETEKHKEEVVQVRNEIKKKEEEMANLENREVESNNNELRSSEERTKLLETGKLLDELEGIALQNREVLSCDKSDGFEDLMKEVVSLREYNELMEMELKEMQGRYSEISLKFAEVEGERQKLVMTVRYLKNSKRS